MEKLQKKIPVDVEAYGDYNWVQSRVFEKYFIFCLQNVRTADVDCNALINKPPTSQDGLYFGGISDPMKSERHAKERHGLCQRTNCKIHRRGSTD